MTNNNFVEQPVEENIKKCNNELLKQIEFRKHIQTVETLEQLIKTEEFADCTEAATRQISNLESSEDDTENAEQFLQQINEISNQIKKEISDRSEGDYSKNDTLESCHNHSKDFPDKVNKIIQRVENIYTQLEDIHLAVS